MKPLPVTLLCAALLSSSAHCTDESQTQTQTKTLMFSTEPLSVETCHRMAEAGVLSAENPVPCERLRRVNFSYLNASGQVQDDGQLVVLDLIAPQVMKLMQALLHQSFAIWQARPMEHYGGDDDASMAANNSSAFNGRLITSGASEEESWSLHAYGVAIDINPLQNPWLATAADGSLSVKPSAARDYSGERLDAETGEALQPGMVEPVVGLFAEHGFFVWGGDWQDPIDYQHFQVGPRHFVEQLVAAEPAEAEQQLVDLITVYKQCYQSLASASDPRQVRADCAQVILSCMP